MTIQLNPADFYKWFMSLPEKKARDHISVLQQLRVVGKDSELLKQMNNCLGDDYPDESFSVNHEDSVDNELKVATYQPTDEKTYQLIEEITPIIESLPTELICFKDTKFSFMNCNNGFLSFGKFASKNEVIGRTDFEMPWEDQTAFYRKLDRGTLAGQSFLTLMPLQITTGERIIVLQDKRPLLDYSGVIRGTAINMRRIERPEILKPFITFSEHDLIISEIKDYISDKYLVRKTYSDKFSEMESVCMFYYIRGRTAKEIAKILSKSKFTVETYLERIRYKLDCSSKSEVVSKAHESGLLHIIPETVLYNHLSILEA